MKKKEAIAIFGNNQYDLSDALGKGSSAISQWDEELTSEQVNLVIGAAWRRGRDIPKKFKRV